MNSEDLQQRLAEFLKNDPACQQTLGSLNESAEIALVIGGSLKLCAHFPPEGLQLVEKECQSPDFLFRAAPQAVETMIAEKHLTPAELGIKLAKQYFTDQIQLEMPGHFIHVLRKGYLQIVKTGGLEFLQGLSQYNLESLGKILVFLQSLRSKN